MAFKVPEGAFPVTSGSAKDRAEDYCNRNCYSCSVRDCTQCIFDYKHWSIDREYAFKKWERGA